MSSQLGTEERLALGVRPRGPGAGRSPDPDSSVASDSLERAGSSVSCAAGSSKFVAENYFQSLQVLDLKSAVTRGRIFNLCSAG